MHTNKPTGDSLKGKLSVTFPVNKTFREFCQKHFDNYDPDQHEPIAIRFFKGEETIVTLFALDKFRQEGTNYNIEDKVPVKKFKSGNLSLGDIMDYIEEFNFTLETGNFDLYEMQIINK